MTGNEIETSEQTSLVELVEMLDDAREGTFTRVVGRRDPNGYRPRPFTLTDSFTYKYDAKGRVISSRPPGVLCGEFYLTVDNRFRSVLEDFECETSIKISSDSEYGPLYWIGVPENLTSLLGLSDVQFSGLFKTKLLYYQAWYEDIYRHIGIHSLVTKMGSRSLDNSKYKTPGQPSYKSVPRTVHLSGMEMVQAMMTGQPLTRTELVSEETFDAFAFACSLQHFSPIRLFSQQLVAAAAMLGAERYGIFKDMRTGKTYAAITAALALLYTGQAKRIFVICPVLNMYSTWLTAFQQYGVKAHVLDGTQEEDTLALMDPTNEVVILNYERVGSRTYDILAYTKGDFAIACDESSAIKNPAAKRTRATQRLCWAARWVWLLNGTPLEQGPQDIWAQTACLDPYGFIWGSTYQAYVNKWLAVQGKTNQVVVRADLRAFFEAQLSILSVRYLRSEADQFLGKDKTFRYVKIPPTPQQVKDTADVTEHIAVNRETGDLHELKDHILAMITHWREICNGYNKYPVGEKLLPNGKTQTVYCKQQYEMDAKVLWLEAFLSANSTQPCVIFCEFVEQQQMVKDMLTRIGHTYSSTRHDLTEKRIKSLAPVLPKYVVTALAQEFFYQDSLPGIGLTLPDAKSIQLPDFLRFEQRFVEFVENQFGVGFLNISREYQDHGSFTPEQNSANVEDFQQGRVQHFIAMISQGKGITLNRVPALLNNIGVPPCIIFMNPPQSLGQYQQAQDRCVGVDPKGNSYNNMIYNLFIVGSIEEHILKALRNKKKVQEELLKDVEREGFTSFSQDIVENMAKASDDKSLFDTEEMLGRIRCGVSPLTKLTVRNIDQGIRVKFHLSKTSPIKDVLFQDEKLAESYRYLTSLIGQA